MCRACPEYYLRVAGKPAVLRPFDGTMSVPLLKFFLLKPGNLVEPWSNVAWPRTKSLFFCLRRKLLVPRADVLANVAPVNPPVEFLTEFVGNLAAKFDRQIRYAAIRVDDVRFRDRLCRAC